MPALINKKLFIPIPVILFVHNLEEALTMPQWMSAHRTLLQEKISLFNHLQFSTAQLYLSLVSVTLFPLLLTIYCLRDELSKRKITILLILQSIIFWNALVPHIGGLFLLGMYNPGTVTAVAFNIPFTFFLFRKLERDGVISLHRVRNIPLIGLVLYLPIVYINHLLAEYAVKIFS